MVICLERGADLHMAQPTHCLLLQLEMPLTFWYWLTRVVPEEGPLNGCACCEDHMYSTVPCLVPTLYNEN